MPHPNPKAATDIVGAVDFDKLFRRLLASYQQPLYWHIRHIVGCHEDTEDALQETFIRAYRNIGKLREATNEKAWLYRIATNEALRVIEGRKPAETYEEHHDASHTDAPNYDTLQQALTDAIVSLPPRQRAVFSMRYYDDMAYEDIATAVDSNVKAVTANYHVAKEKIRQYLLNL